MHILLVVAAILPFALNVWAIVVTARDRSVSPTTIVLWVIALFAFPVIGVTIWALWWNRKRNSRVA
ncbi:hypothetical protein A20C1_12772 [marine actinobacterium PHSC20C1]|nr:hypothetical protein A20C1_12772 [marine actinobacterium PHSC20C1]